MKQPIGTPDVFAGRREFTSDEREKIIARVVSGVVKAMLPWYAENDLEKARADVARKVEEAGLVHSGDNVWFIPGGGDVQALVAQIDIAGVLEFVREVRDNVHGALPELSFDELRKKDQIATATLELQLMELVLKVRRTRPNYDAGLVKALRMAGMAAANMNLPEISVLDDPMLELDGARPVLPLDPKTEMELESLALLLEQQRAAVSIQEGVPNDG